MPLSFLVTLVDYLLNTSNPSSPSPIFVHGYGCVSAAGIGSSAIYETCMQKREIPLESRERIVGDQTVVSDVRAVDAVALRAAMPKHPRLRRASSVTKFAITAAYEALGQERVEQIQQGEFRLGIIVSFINGCVNYSNRFYAEVLDDPKFASPILFPETVYNAPASHVASFLNSAGPAYTLIGDSSAWFSAVKMGQEWLRSDQVDGCLVICAEELDWLVKEALSLYSRDLHATEGAAAMYLEKEPSEIELEEMLGPFDYTTTDERREAINDAWAIKKNESQTMLVDGLTGVEKIDRDEKQALQAWSGARVSPAVTLGSGSGACCGFQTIVALEALRKGHPSSVVMASGTNQHAFSARFQKK